jgi:hypothetical protein
VDKLDIAELQCEKQGVVENPLRVSIGLCFSHYKTHRSATCQWSCSTIRDSKRKLVENIGYTYSEENADRIAQEYTNGREKFWATKGPVFFTELVETSQRWRKEQALQSGYTRGTRHQHAPDRRLAAQQVPFWILSPNIRYPSEDFRGFANILS